jgi:quercetin dioxygenase-like cupin family protein
MAARRPRRLNPLELVDLTRFYAGEVEAGQYPFVDFDPSHRWHQRIYRDPRVDVWLISWLPEQGTQLHDHGGSSGAFTVLSGRLTEAVFSAGVLREFTHLGGTSVGFGAHYVHDVRNIGDESAVSVHAYSTPLTSMNYYDLDGVRLVPVATVQTDDPEPAVEVRVAS